MVLHDTGEATPGFMGKTLREFLSSWGTAGDIGRLGLLEDLRARFDFVVARGCPSTFRSRNEAERLLSTTVFGFPLDKQATGAGGQVRSAGGGLIETPPKPNKTLHEPHDSMTCPLLWEGCRV